MFRSSDHDPVVVGIRLGENVNVNELPFDEKVKIYPTVVSEILHIDNAEDAYVQIFSVNGIKLYQQLLKGNELNVKEAGLIPGAYIIRVLDENRIVSRIIFVK